MIDLQAVDAGFSRKAEVYDAYCENHPVIRWQRALIRAEVVRRLSPGGRILELNAGTGSDAAWFVEQGFPVHATDVAAGMLAAIQGKITRLKAAERFTVQQLSFTELSQAQGAPYDLVFSNFGGLNCIADLSTVTRHMGQVLKPGGYVVWCIMPPVCPWEIVQVLRGSFRVGLRRFSPHGVRANVEGAAVPTWYHAPRRVKAAFGSQFRCVRQQAISLFCPPSYMERFPVRFPALTGRLQKLDESLGGHFPFSGWGDFVLYTFQYAG